MDVRGRALVHLADIRPSGNGRRCRLSLGFHSLFTFPQVIQTVIEAVKLDPDQFDLKCKNQRALEEPIFDLNTGKAV